jgi:hypothetical protein
VLVITDLGGMKDDQFKASLGYTEKLFKKIK